MIRVMLQQLRDHRPFRINVVSTLLLVFCCANLVVSELRRCSDYDYELFFPRLTTHRFIQIENLPDIVDYTLCTWAKPTFFTSTYQVFASYATSDSIADLDRIFIGFREGRNKMFYLWRSPDTAKSITLYSSVVNNFNLNQWHHVCFERQSVPGSIAFYLNGSLLTSHEDPRVGAVHPGGGIFMLGEEQDTRGGGFDFNQAYYGGFAHYNMWDYLLGPTVIAELFTRKGGTENGNLVSWPDIKSNLIVGDARVLRPSQFYQPLAGYQCSWSNWRCNSEFCAGADLNCVNDVPTLRIESCYHYYMCYFPMCPKNCRELLEFGKNEDFLYIVDPTKSGPSRTYCDQSTNGGGWNVIQRRMSGEENFDRDWKDYQGRFGYLNREMWLGNELIHNITAGRATPLEILVEATTTVGAGGTSREIDSTYREFSVSNEDSKYALSVSGFISGNDQLSTHSGLAFTTKDQDNDESASNCASSEGGGWWYNNCGDVNLNGHYPAASVSLYWERANILTYSEMKVRLREVNFTRPWQFLFRFPNRDPGYILIRRLTSLRHFTISWWMRSERARGAWTTVFSNKMIGSSSSLLAFSFKNYQDFKIVISDNVASGSLPKYTFTDSNWHHFVLIWSMTDGLTSLYLDGISRFTASLSTNVQIPRNGRLAIGINQQSNGNMDPETQFLGDLTRFNIWSRVLASEELISVMKCTYNGSGDLLAWPDLRYWTHGDVRLQHDGNQTCHDQQRHDGKYHWSFHNESSPQEFLDDMGVFRVTTRGDNVTSRDKALVFHGNGEAVIQQLQGECVDDPQRCQGRGITLSMWMQHGGLISDILKDDKVYHRTLMSWLEPIVLPSAQWYRCFKASENGWHGAILHESCDHKGPTVTLVKVRDYIFGGFLDQNWGGTTRYLPSRQAFLFSIYGPDKQHSPVMMLVEQPSFEKAVKAGVSGLQFGVGPDLSISEDLKSGQSNLGTSFALPSGYEKNTTRAKNFLAGMKNFSVDELEMFYMFNYSVLPVEATPQGQPADFENLIISSGAESDLGTGLAFYRAWNKSQNRAPYAFTLRTTHREWRLNVGNLSAGWNHISFTWNWKDGLKFYLDGILTNQLREGTTVITNEEVMPNTDNGLRIGDPSSPQSLKIMNLKIENGIVLPTLLVYDHLQGLFHYNNTKDYLPQYYPDSDFSWSMGRSETPSKQTGPSQGFNDNFSGNRALYRLTGDSRNGLLWKQTLLAVDGSTSTAVSDESCSVVDGATGVSWWIDFGESVDVSKIYISSSSQCCALVSPDVVITVQDSLSSTPSPDMQCGNEHSLSSSDEHFITCPQTLNGRYLVIRPVSQSLSFCEIAVFDGIPSYFYVESSYPRTKGEKASLKSGYFNAAYNCLSFKYHMNGDTVGRLDVFTEDNEGSSRRVWILVGNQSASWSEAKARLVNKRPFKVVVTGVVGDGYEGDIAVDSIVVTMDYNCSVLPVEATPKGQLAGFRSGIFGDFKDHQSHLLSRLSLATNQSYWTTCYRLNNHTKTNLTAQQNYVNKGPTLIIVRKRNIVFGAFSDQSWTGSDTSVWSVNSFLFLFSKPGSFNVFQLDENERGSAMFHSPSCPSFGRSGAELKINLSSGVVHLQAPAVTYQGFQDFYDVITNESGSSFVASDIEVLETSYSVCHPPCLLNQYCDEIVGKCLCDVRYRPLAWCKLGTTIETLFKHSTHYWSMDEYDYLKDSHEMRWGDAAGRITFDRGVNNEGVHFTETFAYVDLGSGHACLNMPSSCVNGSSISLWMKYSFKSRTLESLKSTLVSVGSINGESEGLSMMHVNQTFEHLALLYGASNRKCMFVFYAPESVWIHVTIAWHPHSDLVIYLNGEKVVDFLEFWCVAKALVVNSGHLVLRGGHNVHVRYDEVAIWDHVVTPETARFVYEYYYKNYPIINVKLILQIQTLPWNEEILDKESAIYRNLSIAITEGIKNLYEEESKMSNIKVERCWNDEGVVCEILVDFMASNYDELVPFEKALVEDGILGSTVVKVKTMQVYNVPTFGFNFTVISKDPKSFTVSWQILDQIDVHFQGFHMFYRSRMSNITENVTCYGLRNECELSLTHWAVYYIHIVPFSLTGMGKRSSVKTVESMEAAPMFYPNNVTANAGSSTSLFTQWDHVRIEYYYRMIDGYVIVVREEENPSMIVINTTLNNSTTSLRLNGLKKFTLYNVQVAALGVKIGPFMNVTVRTAEDTPSLPPVNLTAPIRMSRSLYVTWENVPEGFLHGILRSYKIQYYQTSLGISTIKSVNVAAQQETRRRRRAVIPRSAELVDLLPYTNYTVHITAITIGEGVWSEWLTYITDEEVPKSPPLNLIVHNTSSTSLMVSWVPVPVPLRDGVIRGYWISYQRVNFTNANTTRIKIEPSRTSFEIQNLRKYTTYDIKMTAFTIKGESNETEVVKYTTDQDVPSLPPTHLRFIATGFKSLLITWGSVPADFQHGIIIGYQVRYKTLEGLEFVFNLTSSVTKLDFANLNIYSPYPTSVAAFTIKGLGPWDVVTAITGSPGPFRSPPSFTVLPRTHLTMLTVSWPKVNTTKTYGDFAIRGIQIYYHEVSVGLVKVKEQVEKITVCRDVEAGQCFISGLKPFTLYRLRAGWLNEVGVGPLSNAVEAETCRCKERFSTNWFNLLPYVNITSDVTNHNSDIVSSVLQSAITFCCLECSTQGQSFVDFRYNGLNGSAQAATEDEMRARIGAETDISFPVFGEKDQTRYGGRFSFTPLIDSPGVALLIRSDPGFSVAMAFSMKIFECWPLIIIMIVLASLAGVLMWILEMKDNPEHFPTNIWYGFTNGFWWAYVTMTTVGYGDRAPVSIAGRVLAIVWSLIGVVISGITVAALTSALALVIKLGDAKYTTVHGSKVGAIGNTSEYRLAVRMSAIMDEKFQYQTVEELYKALMNGQIDVIMLEVYRLGIFKDHIGNQRVRLASIIDNNMVYGAVWNSQSQVLTQCIVQYTKLKRAQIYENVNNSISVAELKTDDALLELSLNVFDPESEIYVKILHCSLTALGILVLLGLIWECVRRKRLKNKVGVIDKPIKSIEPKHYALFQTLLETFQTETKNKVRDILRRHIKEIEIFRKCEENIPGNITFG